MGISKEFDRYMAHLAEGLGHADRHAGLSGYCTGLMLALSRKSIEPMAARVDPLRASARHQALHHFVAKALLTIMRITRKGWSAGTKSSRWRMVNRLSVKVSAPRMDGLSGGSGECLDCPASVAGAESWRGVFQQPAKPMPSLFHPQHHGVTMDEFSYP